MVDSPEVTPYINPNLFKLECKPKPILTHEFGAGSMCLNCDCPGLDLHYWRRKCNACNCRLDQHDVKSEQLGHGEFVIRQLFESNPAKIARYQANYDRNLAKKLYQLQIDEENIQKDCSSKQHAMNDDHSKTRPFRSTENGASLFTEISPTTFSDPALNKCGDGSSDINKSSLEQDPSKTGSFNEYESSLREYNWLPHAEDHIVEKYVMGLPEEERIIIQKENAPLHRQRLVQQLPHYDLDVLQAKSIKSELEREFHKNFVDFIKKNVVGVGDVVESGTFVQSHIASQTSETCDFKGNFSNLGKGDKNFNLDLNCKECRKPLEKDDVGVITEHGNPMEIWHPGCFRCNICHQLLADLVYFYKDNQYYCGRDYSETVYPRCKACDELIFSKEYTFAEEKSWHIDHFCCFGCDKHLGGHRYITKEDQSYCIDCYMDKFARTCMTCQYKIQPFDSRISHKDMHWHANTMCFNCKNCTKALANQKFLLKEEMVFCGTQCKKDYFEKTKK